MLKGTVLSFDSPKGIGIVESDSGAVLTFQCVAISDGTREITPGQKVLFEISPGAPGLFEARSIDKVEL